jgi:hypothetical protein
LRHIVVLLLSSLPAFAGSVTCTGVASTDSSAIQASLNAGGTTTLVNTGHHCVIGTTTLQTATDGTTVTTTTGAQIDYSGSDYAIYMNHNNVTITNLTFNGGGIQTTQNSMTTPQSGGTITGNAFLNITSGANGIESNGYWLNFNISNNRFDTITSVPFASWTGSTNVENGGSPCTSYAGGCNGIGIDNVNGMDHTTINNNTFNKIIGNGMSVKFAWTMGTGTYNSAANNSFSYNTFTNLHRMMIEGGGINGCPGGCIYTNSHNVTSLKIAGNFGYNFVAPYLETFGLSIPYNALSPSVINNTAVMAGTSLPGYGIEDSGDNYTEQGNVLTSSTPGGQNWHAYIETGDVRAGFTITHENNYLAGTLNANTNYFASEGCNNETGCPNSGTIINQYNAILSACQIPTACQTSTLALAFSSPDNQSFPSFGNGTWSLFVTDEISIKNVKFFIDGSSTPSATQELQDLSTTFATDKKWLYHDTFNTSALAEGSHTIKAVATDVSGATSSVTQSFTVGTGTGSSPGLSFSPTSVSFGSVAVSSSSTPVTITLTNSGTATLFISGITFTGASQGDFSKTTTCGATLAVAATCNVVVTFSPTATGSRNADLSVTDNASGSPQTVALSGTGTGTTPQFSVSPASGSGTSQAFSFTFSSTAGASSIWQGHMLITGNGTGNQACYLLYQASNNALYMMSDDGAALTGPVTPGGSGTLSNSQCSVAASSVSVTSSGNNLTVRETIAFASAFNGNKSTMMYMYNYADVGTGWGTVGTWTVGSQTPSPFAVSPASGSGATQAFSFTFTSSAGASSIWQGHMLVTGNGTGNQACHLMYQASNNALYLSDDAGNSSTGPVTPGGSGTLSNSQCSVAASSVSVTSSGNSLTVRETIAFTSAFNGNKNTMMYMYNYADVGTGWGTVGTWIVP